jgi:hypothetical protein
MVESFQAKNVSKAQMTKASRLFPLCDTALKKKTKDEMSVSISQQTFVFFPLALVACGNFHG